MEHNNLLKLNSISKNFKTGNDYKNILNDISLSLDYGKIYVLVGSSGAGKSTLAKIIIGLIDNYQGDVIYKNTKLKNIRERENKEAFSIQYIFQDPYASLDDSYTIKKSLNEPYKLGLKKKLADILSPEEVFSYIDLGPYDKWKNRRISSLSGGQRQRIAIARALIPNPDLLIADESTSMLDNDTALSIFEIFKSINKELEMTIFFISHQLFVIKNIAEYIFVLNDSKLIEEGSKDKIINNPEKDYTKRLIYSMKYFEGGELFEEVN